MYKRMAIGVKATIWLHFEVLILIIALVLISKDFGCMSL